MLFSLKSNRIFGLCLQSNYIENNKKSSGSNASLRNTEHNMFAIIKSGGKQYKAKEGAVLKLEKIENGIGEIVEFTDVLMIQNGEEVKIGNPVIEGAKVIAEVVEQARHKKIQVIKFRRRKHSMKRQGHRQYFTAVKITTIQG